MRVAVVCFGAMRDYLPPDADGNRASLKLSNGSRVGDLADVLGAPRRLLFSVLVDGARATEDTALADGAEVTLMPPFTGGAGDAASSNELTAAS
ncbi:hypothetical protein BH18ACT15_BH18ACT15_02530 [soil metagenome]